MRLKAKVNLHYGVVPCFTCDEPFELDVMSWFAYADDGKRLGVLCAGCMTLDAGWDTGEIISPRRTVAPARRMVRGAGHWQHLVAQRRGLRQNLRAQDAPAWEGL
jgi:hypothetical protein